MADSDLANLYLKTDVLIEQEGVLVGATMAKLVTEGVVHVITAWNPGEARPTLEENIAANEKLFARLVSMGLAPVRAVGSDPDSAHSEESWAVRGLDDSEAQKLGAEFGQVAVFRLGLGCQTVLGCFDNWQVSRRL